MYFQEIVKKEKVREAAPLPSSKKSPGGHVANLAKNLGHGGIKMGPPPGQGKGTHNSLICL